MITRGLEVVYPTPGEALPASYGRQLEYAVTGSFVTLGFLSNNMLASSSYMDWGGTRSRHGITMRPAKHGSQTQSSSAA